MYVHKIWLSLLFGSRIRDLKSPQHFKLWNMVVITVKRVLLEKLMLNEMSCIRCHCFVVATTFFFTIFCNMIVVITSYNTKYVVYRTPCSKRFEFIESFSCHYDNVELFWFWSSWKRSVHYNFYYFYYVVRGPHKRRKIYNPQHRGTSQKYGCIIIITQCFISDFLTRFAFYHNVTKIVNPTAKFKFICWLTSWIVKFLVWDTLRGFSRL